MRGVQLDQVEAGRDRPAGRGREGLDDLGDARRADSSARVLAEPGEAQRGTARRAASHRRRRRPGRVPPTGPGSTPCGRRARAGCPARAPWPCRKSTIGAHSACCSSFQMPVSAGEIRPSGTTAVASVSTRPAPPRASDPRCTRCHWSGTPSRAEYWHIGETQTRLRISRSRRRIGVNSWLMRRGAPCGRGRDLSRSQHRCRPPYFIGAPWRVGPTPRSDGSRCPTRAADETPVQRCTTTRRPNRCAAPFPQ